MAKVLTLDLELNQPSGKIIQIGYVIADLRKNTILRKRSLIVDPGEPLGVIQDGRSITELTGITEVDIKFNGRSLQDAYEILCMDVKDCQVQKTPIQWGEGDHNCLREQLGLSWDDYVFRSRKWDAKSLYQIYRAFKGESVAAGLEKTLDSLGMEFIGRPHDAMDDAYNTYRIFYELGIKASNYDRIKKIVG